MNSRVPLIAAIAGALALGVVLFLNSRSTAPAEPAEEPPVATAVPPPPAPTPTPEAAAPAPAPAPRRPAAPKPAEPAAAAPEPEPAPVVADTGTLHIETDVPGAQVFIDREFVGTAPVTAENLRPGTHQLNVSADGYDGIARTLTVEPGRAELMLRFKEVRLDARLAVVHKHRLGSCRGELIATPQGLTYQTDDADDRFTVSLAELGQFEVNYLEKNLRLRVTKGKSYNFTDVDGNADRLFVFHRDVDRARKQLASQ